MKTDILAFGAHPDDTELSCGGTLAALIRQKRRVVVVDLTRGEMGTRGTPELRLKESLEAAKILGLSARDNLELPDTQLVNQREFQLPIIERIRFYQPAICLIGAPRDRHPDHGNASTLLEDAIFYSGLRKIETRGPNGELQPPHRPAHVLSYMQDSPFEPDLVFDISETMDLKERALEAFSSQFNVTDPGEEPETYISGSEYFQGVRARGRTYGHLAGFTYGEPFQYRQPVIPLTSFDVFEQTTPLR